MLLLCSCLSWNVLALQMLSSCWISQSYGKGMWSLVNTAWWLHILIFLLFLGSDIQSQLVLLLTKTAWTRIKNTLSFNFFPATALWLVCIYRIHILILLQHEFLISLFYLHTFVKTCFILISVRCFFVFYVLSPTKTSSFV